MLRLLRKLTKGVGKKEEWHFVNLVQTEEVCCLRLQPPPAGWLALLALALILVPKQSSKIDVSTPVHHQTPDLLWTPEDSLICLGGLPCHSPGPPQSLHTQYLWVPTCSSSHCFLLLVYLTPGRASWLAK